MIFVDRQRLADIMFDLLTGPQESLLLGLLPRAWEPILPARLIDGFGLIAQK